MITRYTIPFLSCLALCQWSTLHAQTQRLTDTVTQLKVVNVTSRKPLVTREIDRTVVNVGASLIASGGSALDVLERAPGVLVDKSGDITVEGRKGVKIYIDGKPAFLSGADLVEMLRSMPADQLDQLEIMPNPPARYDAGGNGAINLKTKKLKSKGFNGNLSVAYLQGRYPGVTASFQFNYRSNKWNLFGNAGYSYKEEYEDYYILRNFRTDAGKAPATIYDQHSFIRHFRKNFTAQLGADYHLSDRTTIGMQLNGFDNPARAYTDNTTLLKNGDGSLRTGVNAPAARNSHWQHLQAGLNMKHRFDNDGHELSADLDYVRYSASDYQRFDNFFHDSTGAPNGKAYTFCTAMPRGIDIYTFKTDYARPLSHNDKLEAGLKLSYVSTDNTTTYHEQAGDSWQLNDSLSNRFLYREQVSAAYLNYRRTLQRWEVQAGLRLEHTTMNGRQAATGERFTNHYLQLFPSAFVAYTLDKHNKLRLSYGRRIERQDYRDLNPFRVYLDRYTYEEGNPYLRPQLSHNIELSHIFMEGALTTTLLYNRTSASIQQLIQQDAADNTTFLRPENLDAYRVAGINVSAYLPVSDHYTAVFNATYTNNRLNGFVNKQPFLLEANVFSASTSHQLKFGKGWMTEVVGSYVSRNIMATFLQRPTGAISAGIQKSILDNNGIIRLTGLDIFRWSRFKGSNRYQQVDVSAYNTWQTQILRVTFIYRFNKGLKVKEHAQQMGAGEEKARVKGF